MIVATCFSDNSLRNKLLQLENLSKKVQLGLNSFPGEDESFLQKWVEIHKIKKPFFVKLEFGLPADARAQDGVIRPARIFVVNPVKTDGMLWWKKIQIHSLKEPDWTLFLQESKPLNNVDFEKLSLLLQD